MTVDNACELCGADGGDTVVRTDKLQVAMMDDGRYPCFRRMVWQAHRREMTDLPPAERTLLMDAVFEVEEAICEVMQPYTSNVASLGDVTPHLHWHVIPVT